jgi:hypothetical protein
MAAALEDAMREVARKGENVTDACRFHVGTHRVSASGGAA